MPLFPTRQWLEAYGRRLDERDTLDDLDLGWNRRFDGNVLFVIEDLPVEETMVDDLPDEALNGIPERIRAEIGDVTVAAAPDTFGESIRPTLPDTTADLLEQIENEVVDETIYAYIDLDEDSSTDVELLAGPDERPADFVLRGPYTTWRRIVDGRPPTAAVIDGSLDIQSTLLRQIQYTGLFQRLGETAAEVETVHLFDGASIPFGERLFDQSVEQSEFVQKTAQRQFSNVFNSL